MGYRLLFSIVALWTLVAVSGSAQEPLQKISGLKFLGEHVVPHNLIFKGTTVGGLSGIDYDAKSNRYFAISDDRSYINPARFYTLKIPVGPKGIDSVVFEDVRSLYQQNGETYPDSKINPYKTPDPESIRFNPKDNTLTWSSEGERETSPLSDPVLQNPSITEIGTDGKFRSPYVLPDCLTMKTTDSGPRKNGTLEGLSFCDDYRSLYTSLEEPLFEDGPKADTQETASLIRIFKFDAKTKKNTAQYAYRLEKVAHGSLPLEGFKLNGISEILAISPTKLLVMERSFSVGRLASVIKIYEADLGKATNIIDNKGLIGNKNFVPAKKRLILNMDDLNRYTDNMEGMTFGPRLPNGHRTLVTITDNNFKIFEKTQVFLFEVLE